MLLLLLTALLVAASPMMAQTSGGMGPLEVKFLGAMLGLGLAAGLCGIGQGRAVAGAAEAIARNPGAQAGIRFALILGLVFIESLTIYALVIVFIRY
jgi:F-type H+-transporting ATPase subunit c